MSGVRTLTEVTDDLEARRVSAVELLEESLARVRQFEPSVQALVTPTFELARAQAGRADARRAAGEGGPLLGVPVVVKDLIDVAGVPTTAGSKVLAENVPGSSAPAWARWERAGAVLVGKANTHEFAYGGTTEPTRNPADTDRIVGGSSGGPAAALAAGYCWGALGTDTAGSVRIPANLCGVAALKPTRGLVDTAGVIPLAPSLDCVGPMARRVRDLQPMLRALADLPPASRRTRERPRVALLPPSGATDGAVVTAFESAVRSFELLGARITPAELPGFEQSLLDNFTVMGFEAHRVHRQWADRVGDYTPYVRDRLAEAAQVTPAARAAALARGDRLRDRIDDLLMTADVILLPGVPLPAPPAYDERVLIGDEWHDRDTALCRNTAFANLTGHPVLAVPAGLSGALPVGIQLVGRRGADLDLIELGAQLEEYLPPGLPTRLR